MKSPKYIVAAIIISLLALCSGPASAWDSRWRFKQNAPPEGHGSGTRAIEMQKKFDHDSMNTFKGTNDGSNGYTVLRNLNGGAMRGYINQDGSSLLRDHNGNFHYVNPRWQSHP